MKKVVLVLMMLLALRTGYGDFDVVEDSVDVVVYDYTYEA